LSADIAQPGIAYRASFFVYVTCILASRTFCSMLFCHFLSSLTVFASLPFITIRRLPSQYIAYYVIRGIRKYRLFWRLSYFLLFVNPFLRKIDAFVLAVFVFPFTMFD